MKIGIDARTILNPEKNPAIGVGHYTYQLIRNILKIDQENEYFLFFDYRVREKDVKKFSMPNVTIKYFPWSDYKKFLPGAYSEILGLATLSGHDLDVLHCTSPDARVPLGYRGKVICTFQDMAVYKCPKYFPKGSTVKARYNRKAMAGRSDKLIAVSENTKKDLLDLFEVKESKIETVFNGVDERFFSEIIQSKEDIKRELKEKFDIQKDYIFFVGTLEPVKNVSRLIHAFKIFKDNAKRKGIKSDYQLVLAGKKGWLSDEFVQTAKDSGVSDDIKFLGYVEGEDLEKLLKNSKIFMMPSLYEGFGMSVLEAMATGTPSIVSDIEPLKSIAGGAVEFVNPLGSEEIADKIEFLIENEEKKAELSRKGIEKAKEFSWEKCAKKTLEIYKQVAEKK